MFNFTAQKRQTDNANCISIPYVVEDQFVGSVTSETPQIYGYKNIVRVATIFNQFNGMKEHKNVDEIFEQYLKSFKTTHYMIDTFSTNFEQIFTLFCKLKFPNMDSILFAETTELIVDYFPVYSWISQGMFFVCYNKEKLTSLIHAYMAIVTVGSSTFMPNYDEYSDKDVNILQNEYILKSKELIQKLNASNESVCVPEPQFSYSSMFKYQTPMDQGQNHEIGVKSQESIYGLQSGISSLWVEENDIPLSILMVIAEILEECVSPIIEQIGKLETTRGKLKIGFPKTTSSSFKFNHSRPQDL